MKMVLQVGAMTLALFLVITAFGSSIGPIELSILGLAFIGGVAYSVREARRRRVAAT